MRSTTTLSVRAIILLAVAFMAAREALPERPLDINLLDATSDWKADLDGGEVAHYAILGDSISLRSDTYVYFLQQMLEAEAGNAGDGYLALANSFSHFDDGTTNRRPGLSYTRSSSWSEVASPNGARSTFGRRAVDGLYSRIGASGWVQVRFFGSRATLHYVREPGAGIVRVTVNGDVVAELDASSPTDTELATFTFDTGQSDPTILNTARFSLVGATTNDPQWTQLNGLHMETGDVGSMFSRLARGGVGPDDFMLCDAGIFHDALESLDPDMVIIMLDQGEQLPYLDYLEPLVDRVEAALPDAEIILVTHHHFSESREADADDMLFVATQRGHGYLNLFDLHESQAHLQELGFLVDDVHLSALGGQWFARHYFDALHGWTTSADWSIHYGQPLSGGLYEIRGSDAQVVNARAGLGSTLFERFILEADSEFYTNLENPATIEGRVEWRLDTPGGRATFQLRNVNTGQYQTVASAAIGMQEMAWTTAPVTAAPFVDSATGRIEARVRVVAVSAFSLFSFEAFFDHVQLRVR